MEVTKETKSQKHDLPAVGQDVTTPKVQKPHIGERNIERSNMLYLYIFLCIIPTAVAFIDYYYGG